MGRDKELKALESINFLISYHKENIAIVSDECGDFPNGEQLTQVINSENSILQYKKEKQRILERLWEI